MFEKINLKLPVQLCRIFLTGIMVVFIMGNLVAIKTATADEVTVINNIQEWKHPVKDVLLKNKVNLYKVELHHKTYPIFYVKFPYDPWFAHNDKFFKPLYYETLKANGFWDYSFVDHSYRCKINITWDKKSKTLTESLDDLK